MAVIAVRLRRLRETPATSSEWARGAEVCEACAVGGGRENKRLGTWENAEAPDTIVHSVFHRDGAGDMGFTSPKNYGFTELNDQNALNVSAASERLFRSYYAHCTNPDPDTLFYLLGAAHSLNDRLMKGVGLNFLDLPEFVALKSLRNYFHHHDELRHAVRVVPLGDHSVATDLLFMCVVPRFMIEEAIEQTANRHKEDARRACQEVFHWYGAAVNINPSLLNFVVRAFERISAAGVQLAGDAVDRFRDSYAYETEIGISHYVDGRISTAAGDVNKLISEIMAATPQ